MPSTLTAGCSAWRAARSRNSFAIQAYRCRIAVVADSGHVLEILRRYLLPSFQIPGPEAGAEVVLSVVRAPRGFRVSCEDAAATAEDTGALVVEAIRMLDSAIVQRLSDHVAIHAGVVKIGAHALLLPGKTHMGKSAMVAELLRQGAEYLSDEFAIIDAAGRACAYPRPLLLRNSGPDQVAVLPDRWNARIPESPVPVGWILALQYDRGASWRVTPMSQSEALLTLLQNTPHVLSDQPQAFANFQRASSAARCYAGCRNEASVAAEHILRLVAA